MDALFVREMLQFLVFWLSAILYLAIFVRVISSWLPNIRIPEIIYSITEPVLGPIRRMLNRSPLGGSMIDFSPLIAFFLIRIISTFLLGALA